MRLTRNFTRSSGKPAALERFSPGIQPGRRLGEILCEGGAQPSFHVRRGPAVPVAAVFRPQPYQFYLIARERRGREEQSKSAISVRNLLDQGINHLGNTRDKW